MTQHVITEMLYIIAGAVIGGIFSHNYPKIQEFFEKKFFRKEIVFAVYD